MATESNVEQVRVLNSELNTHYHLYVRPDRLTEFIWFVLGRRNEMSAAEAEAIRMPGLAWAAVLGLDAIFDRRPRKFPVDDILRWLQETIKERSAVDCTLIEIEKGLELFSKIHPPDLSATEDA